MKEGETKEEEEENALDAGRVPECLQKRRQSITFLLILDDKDRAVCVVHEVVAGGAQHGPLQGTMAAGGDTGNREGLPFSQLDQGLLRGLLGPHHHRAGLELEWLRNKRENQRSRGIRRKKK